MKIVTQDDLREIGRQGEDSLYPSRTRISVGMATCGIASGATAVYKALTDEIDKRGLEAQISRTGCIGLCQQEPLVDVFEPGKPKVTYGRMTPENARELIAGLSAGNGFHKEWALYRTEEDEHIITDTTTRLATKDAQGAIKDVPLFSEHPFFKNQKRIILRNCGLIDPESIEEYIARGGYLALCKALSMMKPQEVIKQVQDSQLRGRGGAGFPTGKKWQLCRQSPGPVKYVVCNADEGDPGAYMDRSILEGDPHSVLEGMITGAYAMGAGEGYFYVRAEYPLAIEKLQAAIIQAEWYGLLGENIFNSGFDFRVHLVEGAGAFVCGEETGLLASIEGAVGEPRPRPPFPAEKGLWGRPTNINNVKTWATIAPIIARGASWYSSIGTEGNRGTTVFSLVGKVKTNGLAEVPLGIKLEEMIFDIGGGILDDKKFKAVQTGGPSGGCMPVSLLDLPVDYERLAEAGSMMGSGGMIVMDEDTCMVDIARYFLEFTSTESCGKCTPCREGTKRMLQILTRIVEGRGRSGDIKELERLARVIKDSSLCGLGATAPNPVLTAIRYFRDECEAHIKYKRCPAGVCREIVSAPCHHTCPAGIDAASYIGYIAQGKFDEALRVIHEATPLAGVCGRVSHHPCELKCTSGKGGESIDVRGLKRFVADRARKTGLPSYKFTKRHDERIAVIGAGPAGLSCAWDLARLGYSVTVFEALPVAGGMLYVGIPAYRLPRDVLDEEIGLIRQAGVEIKTNTTIGGDITLDDLKKQYNAVFIATGAHKDLKLGIPGEDAVGVQNAIDFLSRFNLEGTARVGKRVGVIGGGNAAIDAARTALRAGGQEVHVIYRRTKVEMPADREEVEEAIEEGIKMHFLAAPTRVISENGRMVALECVHMRLGAIDLSARRKPVPQEGSEFTIKLDSLIPAIGQEPDISFLPTSDGYETTKWNTIKVDPGTHATGVAGVFAGGDVVLGPDTVTQAIGHGKAAARSIHKYLRGEDMTPTYEVTRPTARVEPVTLTPEEIDTLIRRPPKSCLPSQERITSNAEVVLGLEEIAAVNEAKRCLRCDWRTTAESVG